jgi:hypothetical protein
MVVAQTSPTPQELADLVTEGVNAVNDLYGRRMAFLPPKPNYRPRREGTITVVRKPEPKA